MNTSRLSKLQSEETEDTEEVRDAVTAAETFLYGGTLRFPAKRHYRSVEIRSEKAAISDSHVIVSLYPGNGVAQVSVNLSLEDAPCDDFIYLHQVLCAKDDLFLIDGEPGSLPGFCEKILKECGLKNPDQGPVSVITELNRFGTCRDPLDLSLDDQRCLYGMLTGDEGYLHVPEALVEERMKQNWTSRDFVRVIAFSGNYLLLNFNRSETYADYIDYQKPYADHYFGELNEYFTMDAPTAGVNHGLFFSVESAQLIHTITRRLMGSSSQPAATHGFFVTDDIKRNKQIRADMIRTLNKLDQVNITELGALDNLVVRNLGIQEKVESIRKLLELVESDLKLLYDTTTSRMVTLLTILGLLFALIQTINSL